MLAVLDITGSMTVSDYTGADGRPASRLDTAKAALRATLAGLPCGSRVALGLFAEHRTFLQFEPIEVCADFAPLDGAIAALDRRMAWEGDSRIAAGLHRAIATAADLVFLTDGQEAPPLPAGGGPPFEGRPGAVRGLIVATAALAHGRTPQKVNQSIVIAAKPEAVWKVVGDFGWIAAWNPALKASAGVAGDKPGEAEGTRTLTFPNGAKLTESLDEWNGKAFKYCYRMSDPEVKALPVSSYSATLSVAPEGAGAKVTWSGRFYRGDTGNEPPEELSDAAGRTAMDAFFGDGLKGLKAKVEGGAGR